MVCDTPDRSIAGDAAWSCGKTVAAQSGEYVMDYSWGAVHVAPDQKKIKKATECTCRGVERWLRAWIVRNFLVEVLIACIHAHISVWCSEKVHFACIFASRQSKIPYASTIPKTSPHDMYVFLQRSQNEVHRSLYVAAPMRDVVTVRQINSSIVCVYGSIRYSRATSCACMQKNAGLYVYLCMIVMCHNLVCPPFSGVLLLLKHHLDQSVPLRTTSARARTMNSACVPSLRFKASAYSWQDVISDP